ncbi:mef2-translation elongation mitochondrial [Malassezia pachydermatis]|uniref:Elongation factor 2 n=1 Tax=Malassezia pachydermatis TaxID=77020 RepID=A0A0M9VPA9_9BASI|nr:mef2-translation elongation mitochondrial [Malassezia pachydermatis]KOS14213.1 mef2-translation elongation mitochondrial [Malassezia pachydermatis]
MARWVSRSSAWWLRACARPPARFFHRSTAQRQAHAVPVDAIRNIGIVAHIDAGKTTLTERLLHLTNSLSLPGLQPPSQEHTATAPGDVDSGSTVTDFLEEERERGITIQSAAVGPVWWTNTSNQQAMAMTLVDTPGHVDFGIEVERTVRVVDGAVVVLDGVEGVEPQSENVWRQTKRYGVQAHLFFINKLDRAGASVARSLRSIVDKGLHERPALLQLPVYRSQAPEEAGANVSSKSDDPLIGVVDLLRMQILRFDGVAGEDVVTISLSEERHGTLYATAAEARHALLELVTSLDVDLLDRLLAMDDPDTAMDSVSLEDVQAALRRLTLQGEVCPVLCGAAACNVGVQPLLDAIGLYLPSPKDRPPVDGILHPDSPRAQATTVELTHPGVSALAFKVVWDKRKGPITFVRVYSGTLQSATSLINTTTHQKERISRLLLPYADQYVDVPALHAGQIGVVLGLKDTRTGDTLVDTKRGTHGKGHHKHDMQTLRLRRVHVPPPVFSVSVEPRSKADEAAVSEALRMLVRTDPSLHVTEGGAGASSQTVLSGMGELHLEIAKHRLEGEFQVHAHLGHVRVGYRETVQEGLEASVTELLDQDLGGKKVQAGVTLQVRPLQDDEVGVARLGGNDVVVDLGETPNLTYESGLTLEQVLLQGAQAALARGPLSGYPMQGVHIRLSHIQVFGTDLSSPAAVRLVVATALRKALGYAQRPKPGERVQGHTKLMEPMMRVAVDAPDTYAGKLTSDISVEQHGSIVEMIHPMEQATPSSSSSSSSSSNYQIYIPPDELDQGSERTDVSQPLTIIALIPLARMMRYSTRLRALTGGTGTYRMTLHGFEAVSPDRERALLQELGRIPR